MESETLLNAEITRLLGVRRSMRLRRIMRQTNLPPEVLINLALEILDIASRKLSPSPIERTSGWARGRPLAKCQPRSAQRCDEASGTGKVAKTRETGAGKNPREK